MVEQSQEYQLAVPLLCSTSLLIGGRCARVAWGTNLQASRDALSDMRHPRPEPWLPYVFTSIDDPRLDEIVGAQLERATLSVSRPLR